MTDAPSPPTVRGSNLRIWNAVAKTDPAHTKKVEFGRKFTSIDAHWQIMQATKQFGPIGEGWGYSVDHSVAVLAETMALAVADVTIWWLGEHELPITQMPTSKPRRSYGPIRGTCEIWSPDKSGKMRVDEDAPKKAMTDALTKGLSHLGFSADVFLGLFDDNRYVQKLKAEFDMVAEAKKDGLLANPDDERSQYEVDKQKKAIAAGWKVTNTTAKGQISQVVDYLNMAPSAIAVNTILKVNADVIAAAPTRDEIVASADDLLRFFNEQATGTAGNAL